MHSKKDHSNPAASDEAAANEKQTNATADVKPDDILPASVEPQSNINEPPLQNKPAQAAAGMGGLNRPLVSKKVGNQNARKHGLYSNSVLHDWESQEDFDCLQQELRAEWKPNGRSEDDAVFDLAYLTLLKWRAVASAKLRFCQATMSDELKSGQCSWNDIIEHQKKVPAHARGALTVATKLMQDATATYEKISSLPYWTHDSEGKAIQQEIFYLKRNFSDLNEQVRKEVIEGVRALVKTIEGSANRFTEVYQADEIEKAVDRQGKFNVAIEKVLRRLIQIKVFKRVDGVDNASAPLVEAPPLVPIEGSTGKSSAEVTKSEEKDRASGEPIAPKAPENRKAEKPKG